MARNLKVDHISPSTSAASVIALHDDLISKYCFHAPKIHTIWRSFSKEQRAIYFNAGLSDEEVLKQFLDTSLGVTYNIAPELNVRDISTDAEFLLGHLEYRTATSLLDQYSDGFRGKFGDRNTIVEMTRGSIARHIDPLRMRLALFGDKGNSSYGNFVEITSDVNKALTYLKPTMLAGFYVPFTAGELILKRQLVIYQKLISLVDNIQYNKILTLSSTKREYKKYMAKKLEQAPPAALSKLTIQERPKKLSLFDLISIAQDQKNNFEKFLSRLSIDDDVDTLLFHAVSIWLISHPELVVDDKGCHLPVMSDKKINGAIFDTIHNTIKGATIWNCICRLLNLLQNSTADQVYRPIILQEISNICHLEYGRAQAQLTRHVQRGIGAKYFERCPNSYDSAGNAKVVMTIHPKELTTVDPHLHCILRLCQPQTNASKAIEWINKLSTMHQAHAPGQKALKERESDSLEYLIAVATFIQDLSQAISIPHLSRKKGQIFVSKSQELEVELSKLRNQVHLPVTAPSMNNLRDFELANATLTELDQFVISKTGSKMGWLYQDLMVDCLEDLANQYQATKARLEKLKYIPLPATATTAPQSVDERVEQRRVKEKTRPSQSTMFEIVQTPKAPEEDPI
ncbi:hypothetical protein ACQKWADRAFT_292281 [Trichoderma austrokoningii]